VRVTAFVLVASLSIPALLSGQEAPTIVAPLPGDVPCDGEFWALVTVDGLQADWEAESAPVERVQTVVGGEPEYDWGGAADASYRAWCRYTDEWLYLAIVARDDVVVAGDDVRRHDAIELRFASGDGGGNVAMVVSTATDDEGYATVRWLRGGSGNVDGARGSVAPRDTGFFVEIGVPLASIPGMERLFAPTPFTLVQWDTDGEDSRERPIAIAHAPIDGDSPPAGRLVTNAVERRVAEIRRQLLLERSVRGELLAPTWTQMGGGPGLDLIFGLGDMLVVTGDGFDDFAWTGVTVRTAADHEPLGITAADLDGDGVSEILYRFARSRRASGADAVIRQEFVVGYALRGSALTRILAQEVASELAGGWRVEMDVLAEPGSRVARFVRPTGDLDPAAFIDADADETTDYEPMLLPWDDADRVDWRPRDDGEWRASRR
jgi:hypothetical protein